MSWWTRSVDFLLGRRRRPVAYREATTYRAPARAAEAQSPAMSLPRFKGTANDLLTASLGSGATEDPLRMKLRKAFTPSHPVSDVRMFAGRQELLLTLIRAIEEQQLHAVIFGDRGIGKTSLLHVLSHLAREARYIVRYTSCSETSEFDDIFRAIAADIPLLYHVDFDPTSEAAERGGSLDELLPEKELSVALMSELLGKLAGTRVLLILDEFDRTTSTKFRSSIAELIKNLSDRSVRVQLVIAGVASNLTELVEHIPSIRRNVVGIPVTNMAESEVTQLLKIGEAVSGLGFDDTALHAIVHVASGSPYLAGLLGQHAGLSALDRLARVIEQEDVDLAIERTLAEVGLRISPRGRQQLDKIREAAPAAELAGLARRALDNFGVIEAPAGTAEPSPVIRRALDIGMLSPVTVGDMAGYQFGDDSIPLYLWLASQATSAPAIPVRAAE